MNPLPACQALDAYFLDVRAKLLEVAAALDRIGRGSDTASVGKDPRLEKIRKALEVLRDSSDGRTERIQKIFSLDYDPGWKRPKPR